MDNINECQWFMMQTRNASVQKHSDQIDKS